jgi:hypothetical protein
MRKVSCCFIVVMLFGILAFPDTSQAQQSHTIILTGYNSVPKVETPARGDAKITLENDTLIVEGSFTNLSGYYFGSAIFYGDKGEQGNKLISLNPTIKESNTGGVFEKENNTFKLTEGQLEALREGNLYINIMSFENQVGELRAQLPAFK